MSDIPAPPRSTDNKLPLYVMDTECYRNYWLIAFRNVETGQVWTQERFNDQPFGQLYWPEGTVVTFNGIGYDMPIIDIARVGAPNLMLKQASDDIIIGQMKHWQLRDKYGVTETFVDHIDLMEVAPGQSGLKIYGGRVHSKRMRDLPIDPNAVLSDADRIVVRDYCLNDLQVTVDLYNQLKPQLELRESMSAEFGIDLRSKSDAQIAEAVIRSEVEKRLGKRIYRPEIHPSYRFKYKVPPWIRFSAPGMNHMLDIIRNTEFFLTADGSVGLPPVLESMHIRVGHGLYRMGIGGLHSSEESASFHADSNAQIIDRDVRSYYPEIVLTQGLYPPHMGVDFLEVYRSLVERRLKAKDAGDKIAADALKICVNGSFGKLGSKWSVLYSPDLLIQVTLTGQLALLVLIEAIEEAGMRVVSANTDGVVTYLQRDRKAEFDAIIAAWEIASGFTTEETEYLALYSRDVNNYIAVKLDGSAKLKGAYAEIGGKGSVLDKNPTNLVCNDAVVDYLSKGVPIETTIALCCDIRRFVTVRQVKGGAICNGTYLGKAIRWYYATGSESDTIRYSTNDNLVPRSEGAKPIMELPNTLPSDINYQWYIDECCSILKELGA